MRSLICRIFARAHGHGGSIRPRRFRRFTLLLTPGNLAATIMFTCAILIVGATVIPYRVSNSSQVCNICGGFRYRLVHSYAGIPVRKNETFVETLGSRLYREIIAPTHDHEWILSGQYIVTGTMFVPADVQVVCGQGAARSAQIEQSLLVLRETQMAN